MRTPSEASFPAFIIGRSNNQRFPRVPRQRFPRVPRRGVRTRRANIIGQLGRKAFPSGRQLQSFLTQREGEIIDLLTADKTCREAAHALSLSVRTVEHYLDRLKLRLGKKTIHGVVAL